jgi:two-component system LytT family sensor kinase
MEATSKAGNREVQDDVARTEGAATIPRPAGRPKKVRLFWLLQCGGWGAFGLAMFLWGLEYWSPVETLVNKVLLVIVGFALTLLVRPLYRGARARSWGPAASGLLVLGVSFGGAAAWIELHENLLRAYDAIASGHGIAWRWTTIPIGMLLLYGLVLLAWSLLYSGASAWTELEDQRQRASRAEALARDARLRALQSQLEPHFLFNTLNAISTLVVEGNNAAAAQMIARLSDFLRLTLDTVDTPEITVAEELEFVRRYLEIEQVRFGERLRVRIEATADAMSGMVPALILQPLVENAVKHGVLQQETGGSVAVAITKDGEWLHICVADDGPGLRSDPPSRQGVGLGNTATRLAELYGGHSRLSLDSPRGAGLEATIEIPFRRVRSDDVEAALVRGGPA